MIILGIQPTGRIHIGNYFGVLQKGLELQKTTYVKVLIARYHANCSYNDAIIFRDRIRSLGFFDISLQNADVLELFYQLAHSESVAELSRLPQFQTKEKTLHMLSYPLLMACDIIISGADEVLVGEDQEPHMHYYREVARKNGFKIAKSIILPDRQIKSIKDPSKKMSKSLGDDHCIYLDDSLEEMEKKIGKALTTPEGIKELKKISSFINYDYDELNNGKSKEELSKKLFEHLNVN